MIESKHTPEPWSAGVSKYKGELHFTAVPVGNEGKITALCGLAGANDEDESIANARRIAACVNACAGMTNEQIDNVCMISGSLLNRFGEQMAYLGQVEKQRDELLKAIALAMPVMDAHAGPSRLADFRAAIASVKGEHP